MGIAQQRQLTRHLLADPQILLDRFNRHETHEFERFPSEKWHCCSLRRYRSSRRRRPWSAYFLELFPPEFFERLFLLVAQHGKGFVHECCAVERWLPLLRPVLTA